MSKDNQVTIKFNEDKIRTVIFTVFCLIFLWVFIGGSNLFSREGICEGCGNTSKLREYRNKFGTSMYCDNCYDLNHFLDN